MKNSGRKREKGGKKGEREEKITNAKKKDECDAKKDHAYCK